MVLGLEHPVDAPFHGVGHMLRFVAATLIALGLLSQVDLYLTQGRYTDGALAMGREIFRSF
jgi:hypothetical protein